MAVLAKYKSLLSAVAGSPALSHGLTFDLCYANHGSAGFDQDRHFVFLRHVPGETKLIAANFSDIRADMRLKIPPHAFEYLSIPETGELNSGTEVRVEAGPWDGSVTTFGIPSK